MSDGELNPTPRLWALDGFRDDVWVNSDTIDRNQPVIVPLDVFLTLDDEARQEQADGIGVELQPGERLESILPHLDHIPLIALAFPAFSDGRSYSNAQLLRSRHNYRGTIRATGEVLIDQIPLMLRAGIDEFVVSDETALDRLADGLVGGLSNHCQPAAKAAKNTEGFSWRRQSA